MKRAIALFQLLSILLSLLTPIPVKAVGHDSSAHQASVCDSATIHYHRRHADYENWGMDVWGPTPLDGLVTWTSPLEPSGEDNFGLYWEIKLNSDASHINYIIHRGNEKDPGPDQIMVFDQIGCEIWQVQGRLDQFNNPEAAISSLVVNINPSQPLADNQVILHYRRIEADYGGWGLHIWGPTAVDGVTWTTPLRPSGFDEFGIFWIIDMQPEADFLEFIIHNGDLKDPGPDQKIVFAQKGRQIWLTEGSGEQFLDPDIAKEELIAAVIGDIKNKAQAHWLSRQYIGWPGDFVQNAVYTLHYDPLGSLQITPDGLHKGGVINLEFISDNLSEDLSDKFPHLGNARLLKIPDQYLDLVPEILKGQIAIQAVSADGSLLGITALQLPGVLDDLYANNDPLGIVWDGSVPELRVWAPTARSVKLILFNQPDTISSTQNTAENTDEFLEINSTPMTWDPNTGIWSVIGEPYWKGKYYLYEVQVYVRQEGRVVTNRVTDPYSLSLSTNSTHSQIADLNDPALSPAGWNDLEKPVLETFTDIILYELHVRDFSARDSSLPAEQRGTFMAFTHPESQGMQHLSWLANQGVTHIHLLPVFDNATIDENKLQWQSLDWDLLASSPPDSDEQQNLTNSIRGKDGYNWGYDPYHYTVPEGSYSIHPDGHIRTIEFRKMVQALNQSGLRVVLDVVYNHTHASGQSEKSVLDRVVPGYYHRLDADGQVENSTCCQNTATEHAMMRRLMIDSVLTWSIAYKVDGFRFDLMGHHMKSDIEALRFELDQLTIEKDGVDGKKIYVYGEGWDFGEVAGNARGINATQEHMAGSGIGTFNDRVRDAVRGGTPFSDQQEQGFATGLFTDPNDSSTLSEASQLNLLLKLKDQIRISIAGNLANYELENYQGQLVTGEAIKYQNRPAGYTHSPQENVSYISAHDNETLFDAIQYKLPISTSIEDRLRAQNLALSIVAFSQGIPFFHAGSELLRSKSMDRDSYDSSDWFNALDWTFQDNNWGHGLPLEDKNGTMWPVIQPLLANPDIDPGYDQIVMSRNLFGKLLQIRQSSPLFRLQSAQQILDLVHFHNTGPDQIPGLIVMSINDQPSPQLDPAYDVVFVLFNADPKPLSFHLKEWRVDNLTLHPVQNDDPYLSRASFDPDTQTFIVPGRSTVVFVGDQPVQSSEQSLPLEATIADNTSHDDENDSRKTPQNITDTPNLVKTSTPSPSGPNKKSNNLLWLAGGGLLIAAGLAGFVYYIKKK
ncbi:MAG: pullulanase-type alpha-1,6-glucosidase [Anaerolineales bacterium]|nr:pullulanase-type alpha-1,6-glucosidase [Anaerolineales bacterium]